MKKQLLKKIFKILIIIALIFLSITTISNAGVIDNPDYFIPSNQNAGTKLTGIGNKIISAIKLIGSFVAVLALIIMGIKFFLGSIEEKADYKQTMLPYLLGAAFAFGIPQILQIIYNLMQ